MANTVRCRAAISRESAHRGITTRQTLEGPNSVHSRASGNPVRFPLAWNLSAVIPGRAEGASPESITTGGDYEPHRADHCLCRRTARCWLGLEASIPWPEPIRLTCENAW